MSFKSPYITSLVVILVMTVISQWGLQRINKRELFLFFSWDMFSGYEKTYNDLVLKDSQGDLYTLAQLNATTFKKNSHLLWYLTQNLDFQNENSQKFSQIKNIIKAEGFEVEKLCKVRGEELAQYILSSKKDSFHHDCQKISDKSS